MSLFKPKSGVFKYAMYVSKFHSNKINVILLYVFTGASIQNVRSQLDLKANLPFRKGSLLITTGLK